jgi:chaperone modulatory protein CbpM
MMTIDGLAQLAGLRIGDLERWVELAWVRPDGEPGQWVFREIDVARVRLIVELRDGLHVEEETLPVVLSLMDQLYDTRRQLRLLHRAVEEAAPNPVHARLLALMEN